ncbi:MAG: outer membrane protein assembly factor BamD [Reinekea sp.]|jgi:outer membrane protein assembly factor BamD
MFTVAQTVKKVSQIAFLAFVVLLTGCASFGNKVKDTESGYYDAAQTYLDQRNYSLAIERLTDLQSRFPFGRFAQASALDLIYARYQSNDFATALIEADRFTRLNPDYPSVDYAWFLRSMSYYRLFLANRGIFGKVDPAMRSPEQGQKAFFALLEFSDQFPDSAYRDPALTAMIVLKDALARHELIVADFYIRRGAWVAAAERAQVVVQHYPGVSAEADALVVLTEAYGALELDEDRQITLTRLQTTYPEHAVFASGSYQAPKWAEDRWWVKLLTLGLIS